MATFILLANWTKEGFRDIKDSPDRLDSFKAACKEHGAQITAYYMTMGPYDMVIIVEAPDDETVARLALQGGAQGHTRTLTLKAFSEDQYREIVTSLG
ncbi:GYD domain-containing protein [Hoeflea sp. TYP-13]|uniref:GYD domain-containing protein n=1 Tax=Hoeflea sp. TYP-13 TaxID=3230023 RepID=UPI0034C62AE3